MSDKAMMLPMISEKEFCEHIEDDDFPIRYGHPAVVSAYSDGETPSGWGLGRGLIKKR